MSLGPQNPNKMLTYLVDLLGNLLSRNHVSNFSDLKNEMLVGRNTPSIGETFGDLLRQIDYMPRPCPNMARKFGIFEFSQKVVAMILNRKLLVS